MNPILVVGSVALDSVKTTAGECEEALGGSAVYFSLAARQLAPVSLVGVVGEDFPAEHRRMLAARGVELSGLRSARGKTFRWRGRYGRDASVAKTLETRLNVFKDFRPRLSEEHARAEVVFLANIDPALQSEVLDQIRAPKFVACDTMNFWIDSKPEEVKAVLARVNAFFCNEDEAERLTRTDNPLQAADAISAWGPSVVAVKKGEHGCVLKAGGRFYAYPAYPLPRIVDPTGAGDSFAGGFMGYLASAGVFGDVEHLKRAVMYGTALASFDVEDFSTRRLESLGREEVDERVHDLIERLRVPRAEELLKPRRPALAGRR